MAIKVPYGLADLENIADCLEIEVSPSGKNGRYYAEDYIKPIRDFYLVDRYGSLDNTPDYMKEILRYNSPMLARRIDSLDEEFQKHIMEDEDYIYEEKLNGMRAVIIKGENFIEVFSRHSSSEDLLPISLGDNISSILELRKTINKINETHPKIFVLDSELDMSEDDVEKMKSAGYIGEEATKLQAITSIMNSTPSRALSIQEELDIKLCFNIFDCMKYKGIDITSLELRKRKKAVSILKSLISGVLKIEDIPEAVTKEDKDKLLEKLILEGKEGVVAKSIYSTYRHDGNRGKDDWIKIKPSASMRARILNKGRKEVEEDPYDTSFIGDLDGIVNGLFNEPSYKDTIDGFITDCKPGKGEFEGMLGSIEVSVFVVKEDGSRYKHPIAWISGFDLELRKRMTKIDGDEISLNDEFYYQVVEIDGQGISHVNRRLNHARLIDLRFDKSPNECEIEESFLEIIV